jgi:hypothetical protein
MTKARKSMINEHSDLFINENLIFFYGLSSKHVFELTKLNFEIK